MLLDRRILRRRLRAAKKGSSPGPTGWRYEFLQLFLRTQHSFAAFAELAEAFANARAPPVLVDGLAVSAMSALCKPAGGVRPIAAPDCLRRVVASTVCSQFKDRFRDYLGDQQFAVRPHARSAFVRPKHTRSPWHNA